MSLTTTPTYENSYKLFHNLSPFY